MTDRCDVVVCGGGIAGGAIGLALSRAGLRVRILEFQEEYENLVRGEMLSPWGTGEAERLGVADAIYAADPAVLRRWVQWDEVYEPDEAPTVDLTQTFVPGVAGPLAIHHYKTCEALVTKAQVAGADLLMGVRDLEVVPGTNPSVRYTHDGARFETQARIVIGAGGRYGPIGRMLGLKLRRYSHHWGGGLAVEGLDEWPQGLQVMGTEDDRMFFVFPQKHGRARLYLNFPTENARRYAGRDGTQRFLADFNLRCMPLSEQVLSARPVGRCMTSPSLETSLDTPYADGVVLIGDEAGANDPVLGTGLSNAMRDARIVAEILFASDDWRSHRFEPYAAERRERMRKLNFAAGLLGTLSAEFGPEARARRRRAWDRMRVNPNYMVTMMVAMAGPDRVPAFGFSPYLVDRLLADDRNQVLRKPTLMTREVMPHAVDDLVDLGASAGTD